MRMKPVLALWVTAPALLFTTVSHAQEAQPQGQDQRPCAADMQHLIASGACKERQGCLKVHLDLLSKACLAKISERNAQHAKKLSPGGAAAPDLE